MKKKGQFTLQKIEQNKWMNPQKQFGAIVMCKQIDRIKLPKSSPIEQHKIPSHPQLHRINLNANSSSKLNDTNKQRFSIQKYRLNQNYFTKGDLFQQHNFLQVFQNDEIFVGGIQNGMRHGIGILITKNIVYEGHFSLNHKDGKGYIQYPNKSKYYGDFSNDKPHGHGTLEYGGQFYIGGFQNGMMHGDGLWKNQKGQKYLGKWKINKAQGYGLYETQNSDYQGQFNSFQKDGYGIQTFRNGDTYKGQYLQGKPKGYGQYIWRSGVTYKGNFINGLRQGHGIWNNQIGDQYQGKFRNDRKNGEGKYTWQNGNAYKGNFLEDMRHGQGQMLWNDASIYQGAWKNGLPNGKGIYKAKGQTHKYGLFQNNFLVQQLRRPSLNKPKGQTKNKKSHNFQKSKIYPNLISQFSTKTKMPQSRSLNLKKVSVSRDSGSTMSSFKISTVRNRLNRRNK